MHETEGSVALLPEPFEVSVDAVAKAAAAARQALERAKKYRRRISQPSARVIDATEEESESEQHSHLSH